MKETINVGTSANDGTGDHLRDAFIKVNDNFSEIYTFTVVDDTGDRTLALTDNYSCVVINNAVDCNISIPTHADVAFPVGATLLLIGIGEGAVYILANAGVDINSPDGMNKLRTKFSAGCLTQIAEDSWIISGDLG